jgi:hypothetical protein
MTALRITTLARQYVSAPIETDTEFMRFLAIRRERARERNCDERD